MGAEGKVQLAAKMADITKRRLAHIAEPGFIFARASAEKRHPLTDELTSEMTLFLFLQYIATGCLSFVSVCDRVEITYVASYRSTGTSAPRRVCVVVRPRLSPRPPFIVFIRLFIK